MEFALLIKPAGEQQAVVVGIPVLADSLFQERGAISAGQAKLELEGEEFLRGLGERVLFQGVGNTPDVFGREDDIGVGEKLQRFEAGGIGSGDGQGENLPDGVVAGLRIEREKLGDGVTHRTVLRIDPLRLTGVEKGLSEVFLHRAEIGGEEEVVDVGRFGAQQVLNGGFGHAGFPQNQGQTRQMAEVFGLNSGELGEGEVEFESVARGDFLL